MKESSDEDLRLVYDRATNPRRQTLFAAIHARSVFEARRVPIDEQPAFSAELPSAAYREAYDYLIAGIRHLENVGPVKESDNVLYLAAQMLEKLFLYEPLESPRRTEELFTAAIAYYLSGHYASAYVIMKSIESTPETLQSFRLLQNIFSKSLFKIRKETIIIWTMLDFTSGQTRSVALSSDSASIGSDPPDV